MLGMAQSNAAGQNVLPKLFSSISISSRLTWPTSMSHLSIVLSLVALMQSHLAKSMTFIAISLLYNGGSRYLCTVESCESSTIGFARKDKLVKHMREKHDNVRCSLNHCGSVLLDGEQESHLQNFHGTYECAFGACEHSLPSHFSKEALRLHLISVHNVYRETATRILRAADQSVDKTARQNSTNMRRQLAECQGCLEHLPAAN